MIHFPTRKEIRKRKKLTQARIAVTFAHAAKAATPASARPAKIKTAAEALNDNTEILKGLARSYLKMQPALGKEGREVLLKGKASDGLAIIACASLLSIDSDAEHA